MHYSKHTRTSCYINSALPSQSQALSLGRGEKPIYLIHVPFRMVYIVVNTSNYQFCQILRRICGLARQRIAVFGRKKVWRQMETGPRYWSKRVYITTMPRRSFLWFPESQPVSTDKPMSKSTREQAQAGHLPD